MQTATAHMSAVSQSNLPAPSAAVHFLQRTSYGIRDSDLSRYQAIGPEAYLDEQLHPELIDDSSVDGFIADQFPGLSLQPVELFQLAQQNMQENVRVDLQLKIATLLRRWFSRRQLYEIMVEFWSDHFSIYQDDGPLRFLKIIDDRDVIRPYALGKFRDLLHASAKSPAMLVYLDNFNSSKAGPNENYARELMELHTLGVDGGFTEDDVIAVARCFTGWSIDRGAAPGTFRFYPQLHDFDEKIVLGVMITAGQGVEDGEQVLDILATQPATAQFIATKLCRRFVSDEPPQSLVDRVAHTFQATDGDIREMLYTVLFSAEFSAAHDAKFKRPVEFIGALLRGLPVTVEDAQSVTGLVRVLGQVPFSWPPPNGYPDVKSYWATTNGLLNRWNYCFALTASQLAGLDFDLQALVGSAPAPAQLVDQLAVRVLRRPLHETDRTVLIHYASAGGAIVGPVPQERAAGLLGLMLNSAYFQLR